MEIWRGLPFCGVGGQYPFTTWICSPIQKLSESYCFEVFYKGFITYTQLFNWPLAIKLKSLVPLPPEDWRMGLKVPSL